MTDPTNTKSTLTTEDSNRLKAAVREYVRATNQADRLDEQRRIVREQQNKAYTQLAALIASLAPTTGADVRIAITDDNPDTPNLLVQGVHTRHGEYRVEIHKLRTA